MRPRLRRTSKSLVAWERYRALTISCRAAKEKGAPKEKGARSAPLPASCRSRSALRELERPASLGAAVLLALDHAAVAGEEAAALEHRAQLRLVVGQRLRQAVAHRAGLAREAAAGHRADDVVLAVAVGRDQR